MTRHRPCPVGLKRPSIYRKDVAFPSNRRGFDGQAPIIRLRQGPVCCPARPKSGISENDAHRAHDGVFQTKAQGVSPPDSDWIPSARATRGSPGEDGDDLFAALAGHQLGRLSAVRQPAAPRSVNCR